MYAKWWETLQYVLEYSFSAKMGQKKCKDFHTYCLDKNLIYQNDNTKKYYLHKSIRKVV